MAVTTLAEIAHRATTVWPLGSVPYSMASTRSPTGHRQDCSGYASACLGLPPPGESTVTLVTKGLVRPISWSEMRAGDLVGRMGPGTEGAAGHVMVVVAATDRMYTVLEQRGGTSGPVRGIYQTGGPAGYRPYRLIGVSTEEDDMDSRTFADIVTTLLLGATEAGYWDPAKTVEPHLRNMAHHVQRLNVAAVERRLTDRIAALEAKLATGGVDVDAIAAAVTERIADAVADKLAQRLAE